MVHGWLWGLRVSNGNDGTVSPLSGVVKGGWAMSIVQELDWLQADGLLDAAQRQAIERALRQRMAARQASPLFLMIYGVCGLVVAGALFTLLRTVWDHWHGTGVLWASSAMMGGLFTAAWALWARPSLRAMAGTLATVGVCLACAAYGGLAGVMGLSLSMGDGTLWFTKGHWSWMWVWLAVVGSVAFRAMPFPLLAMPVLFAVFCLFVRGAYVALGVTHLNPGPACWVACVYGVVMVLAGWLADRRTEWQVAPWFYTLGALAVIVSLEVLFFQVYRQPTVAWLLVAVFGLMFMALGYLVSRVGRQVRQFPLFYLLGAVMVWWSTASLAWVEWQKVPGVLIVWYLANLLAVLPALLLARREMVLLSLASQFACWFHWFHGWGLKEAGFSGAVALLALIIMALGAVLEVRQNSLRQWLAARLPADWVGRFPSLQPNPMEQFGPP